MKDFIIITNRSMNVLLLTGRTELKKLEDVFSKTLLWLNFEAVLVYSIICTATPACG